MFQEYTGAIAFAHHHLREYGVGRKRLLMKNLGGSQTQMLWLDGDPTFRDFNFTDSIWNEIPTHQEIAKWVCDARLGDTVASDQFAETMYLTLRPAAFEAYLRTYPRKAITYTEYFYSKLRQFLRMLLDSDPLTPYMERGPKFLRVPDYSDAWLEPDVPLLELRPEDNDRIDWHELARIVSERSGDRPEALRAWFCQQLPASTPNMRQTSPATALRSKLVQQALAEGKSRRQVCELLDRHGIAVSSKMMMAGIVNWTMAWDDKQYRADVQTMISKALNQVSSPA